MKNMFIMTLINGLGLIHIFLSLEKSHIHMFLDDYSLHFSTGENMLTSASSLKC